MSSGQAKPELKPGKARVYVNDQLQLHVTGKQLVCDVLVEPGTAWRCQHEFEVLVENARLALHASAWEPLLPDLQQHWRVVEQRDNSITVLWPEN